MNVTIDRGNLGREVIRNWEKIHLNVNLLMHGNWVAYFRTWRRRSLFSGRAQTCGNQSNVWNSRRLLRVTLKFMTKISFARIYLPRWTSWAEPQRSKIWGSVSGGDRVARARCPRSSVEDGQKCLKFKKHQRTTFFSPSENRCLPASSLKLEETRVCCRLRTVNAQDQHEGLE